MKRTVFSLVLFLAVLGAWLPRTARADDEQTWIPTADEVQRAATRQACYPSERRCPPRRKAWEFLIAVPVWIPGVSGSFGEGSVSVDSDGGLGDTANDLFDVETDLNFAFVGLVQAKHGPWSFTVEGFGVRLGNNISFKLGDGALIEAELEAIIASATVGYRVWTKPFCLFSRKSCFTIYAFAGARFYHAGFEALLPVGPKLDASADWVDPIVGIDTKLAFSRRLSLHVGADVGGFGVGADFAWWLKTGLEYRFSRLFSLSAGWAFMDADYSKGSGENEFRWNLTLSGPQLVAAFYF